MGGAGLGTATGDFHRTHHLPIGTGTVRLRGGNRSPRGSGWVGRARDQQAEMHSRRASNTTDYRVEWRLLLRSPGRVGWKITFPRNRCRAGATKQGAFALGGGGAGQGEGTNKDCIHFPRGN